MADASLFRIIAKLDASNMTRMSEGHINEPGPTPTEGADLFNLDSVLVIYVFSAYPGPPGLCILGPM